MKFSQQRDTNQARIFLLLPLILQHKMKKPPHHTLFSLVGMELFFFIVTGNTKRHPLLVPLQVAQTNLQDCVAFFCVISALYFYIKVTSKHYTLKQGCMNTNKPPKNSVSPKHATHVHWLPGNCRTSRWLQEDLVLPTCYWVSPPPLLFSLF